MALATHSRFFKHPTLIILSYFKLVDHFSDYFRDKKVISILRNMRQRAVEKIFPPLKKRIGKRAVEVFSFKGIVNYRLGCHLLPISYHIFHLFPTLFFLTEYLLFM